MPHINSWGRINKRLYEPIPVTRVVGLMVSGNLYENGKQNIQFKTGFHFFALRSKDLMEKSNF